MTGRLTARQRQVLGLIADGLTVGEVAARLFISPATVKTHVRLIFRVLGVGSRAHAVAVAFRAGELS